MVKNSNDQHSQPKQAIPCGYPRAPHESLVIVKELGMDEHFAEVTLLTCPVCGQRWLRYFYELEAFTASGRWYMGAITAEQASILNVASAKDILEGLDWYFYGGSYNKGRSGKTSGRIPLNP